MLAALNCEEPDYVPCCFSAFTSLRNKCASQEEFVDRQLEMGLEVAVGIGDLPVRHDPSVSIREWREDAADGPYPILHKEYETPGGVMRTAVNKSEDWPHGDHVPFIDDYLIPRSRKFLVTPEDDLGVLRHLLAPPTDEDVKDFRKRAQAAKALAAERGLLVTGGAGMAGDMACWLSGIQEIMMLTLDRPDLVHDLLGVIEEWNRLRMELALDQGVDVFIRRGWYENADFWSPQQYRDLLLPGLCRDAEQVHGAGAKLGYIMSCSLMPLVDMMMEAGVDVLLGVDPAQDRTMDFRLLKEKTAGKLALWGGVCGCLTVERGAPDDIREQVRRSISILAPGGGFILSPVTNVREDNERVWRNLAALIDTWRSLRGYPRVLSL